MTNEELRANLKDPAFEGRAPLIVGWTVSCLQARGNPLPDDVKRGLDDRRVRRSLGIRNTVRRLSPRRASDPSRLDRRFSPLPIS